MEESNQPDIWTSGEWQLPIGMQERFCRLQEQLEAFKQIALAVTSSLSDDAVMKMICGNISQLMRAERTTLFVVNKSEGRVWLETTMAQHAKTSIRLAFGQGIAGYVAQFKRTLNIKDVYKDPRFDASYDRKQHFRTTSCICSPIFIRNELIGVVQVLNKMSGYFTLDDEELLASICSQIGISIAQYKSYLELSNANAELYDIQVKLRRQNEELEQRNREMKMLYDLECEAARSVDLPAYIEKVLSKALGTFHSQFAACLLLDPSGVRSFEMLSSGDGCPPMKQRSRRRVPSFLRSALERHSASQSNTSVNPELPAASSVEFQVSLHAVIVCPLWQNDKPAGVLMLGRTDERSPTFEDDAGRLITIIASNLSAAVSTHLEREADEKRQRLQTIGQMMSSLLHDMKTPLANISGYAELLADDSLSAENCIRYSETIEHNVDTITNMSAEILQFARGETTILIQKHNICELIHQALEALRSEAEKRKITLNVITHYSGDLQCDSLKIQRVLMNLVKNAMEAISSEGSVTVSSYEDGRYIYIKIEDDGPGIPENIRNTLFDAFVTSGKKGGTGLGLAIVQKIVDEHRAKITCIPVEPHGTAFVIAFEK